MKRQLADLLDIPRLQSALDSLYISSRIPSAIIDNEGIIHTGSGWQDVCTKFHRVHPEARKRCLESDLYIVRHIHEANPSIIYNCPHGMVDSATPIIIEGEHIGNVFTGQLFFQEPDLDFFRAQARTYGFDEGKYIDAVKKVPVISKRELQENLAFIAHLTGMLAEMGLKRSMEKEAGEALRASEQLYRKLFEHMQEGFAYGKMIFENGDPVDYLYLSVNEMFETLTGLHDVVGKRVSEVIPGLRASDPGLFEIFGRVVVTGKPEKFEMFLDALQQWFSMSVYSPEHGYFVAVFDVITHRKRVEEEKERLQDQLQQAMKMEAVGRLAGGVAHDFNNLLTVITGYSELLLQKVGKESPLHKEVEEIKRAGERAASLTQQLLAFSRKQIIKPHLVHLDRLVAEVHTMLTRLVGEDIAMQVITGKALGVVKVDPGQFQQILMNLVVNARDAMPRGGQIVIETANVDLDAGYCARHPFVFPGQFVMLSVSDTGKGMSEEVKAHLFEPFFTTKERGSGTGLGLATTYGTVRQAGGSIDVDSEEGNGTTFRIYLPRVEALEEQVNDKGPRNLPCGTETVLLVEDEESLRNLCARILGALGYQVMQAGNGAEAVAAAVGHGDRIDLLLTDVVMPGMSGDELAAQLVPHYPEMKVLFMSGYTDDAIVHHGVLDDGVSFIGKPYSSEGLARKIREVLDKT